MGRSTNIEYRDVYPREGIPLYRREDSFVDSQSGKTFVRINSLVEDLTNGQICGTHWSSHNSVAVRQVASNGGTTLVASVTEGIAAMQVSTDSGATWSLVPVTGCPVAYGWYDVCWTGTKFIATTTGAAAIATSTDGITWTYAVPTWASSFSSSNIIAANGSTVVIVSSTGSTNLAYSTDGGLNFTNVALPVNMGYGDIIYAGGKFVAVGVSVSGSIFYTSISTDGITWTHYPEPTTYNDTSANMSLAYVNSNYVLSVLGATNIIRVSTTATSWTKRLINSGIPQPLALSKCVYTGGVYYFVTSQSLVIYSTDLVTFNYYPSLCNTVSAKCVWTTTTGVIRWLSSTATNLTNGELDITKKYWHCTTPQIAGLSTNSYYTLD